MTGTDDLFGVLAKADGKPYHKFRELHGTYAMEGYTLHIGDVQGSPSSGPTSMRISMARKISGFPEDSYSNASRRTALGDLMARRFWESGRTHLKAISFPRPGQEILERGSVTVADTHITIHFSIDLPAAGKNAAGRTAAGMFRELETVVRESMFFSSYKRSKLYNHIEMSENADHVRSSLDGCGLVAFIADGSVIPRREDGLAPLSGARVFRCSAADRISLDVPNGDPWTGMGIGTGLTAVAGITGSGRSALLSALVSGVHNHIPGDGRERIVTSENAVPISKQERAVSNADVSSFISGTDTLTADSISGPFAESAAMSEAIEAGCTLLMFDEDSVSPSVLSLDGGMRSLVAGEPVIPVTDMMEGMKDNGISVIAVSGRDSLLSAADRMLVVTDDEHYYVCAERSNARSDRTFERPCSRFPILRVRDGPMVCGILADLGFPKDEGYEHSVRSAAASIAERMDGSLDIRTLSLTDQALAPSSVRVRPIDIAMAVNRAGGLAVIRRPTISDQVKM